MSGAAGGVTAFNVDFLLNKSRPRRFNIAQFANGVLGGLVSITASCAYVNPSEAIYIGAIGGILSGSTIILLEKLKIDDVVSAIPVHLVGGIWGTLSVAIFGDFEMMGLEKSRVEQLIIQIIGTFSICLLYTSPSPRDYAASRMPSSA